MNLTYKSRSIKEYFIKIEGLNGCYYSRLNMLFKYKCKLQIEKKMYNS